jgi:hypothetical protein
MWCPRVSLIGVVVLALSCGGSAKPTTLSSTWVAPAILAQVPADSPYVFASLRPIDEKIRRRMLGTFNHSIGELLKTVGALEARERAELPAWARAGLALAEELRGKDLINWWRELGFDPDGRVVLYGLSVWPVARIEIADPKRVRAVIERVLAATGIQATRSTLDGRAYWSAGNADVTVVGAVLDREAVVAALPTSALPTALPLVLGTQRPAHPLGSTTTVTDLLARNQFLDLMIGYIDLRHALATVTAPTPSPLDAPIRALTGPIPPACRTDLERLVSVMPRLAFGYRKFDAAGFAGLTIFETSPRVAASLKRLRASVPEVALPVAGHPLFAIGAAINPDETIAWLRGLTSDLRARPFTCPWLDGINEAGAELATQLATPLPPTVRGVRGFSLVVDNLTISPFDLEGHLLIAGDRAADLVAMLTGAIPGLPSIPVKPDGRPIELPTQQLHIPVRSAHIAMTSDRIVIASGTGSAQRATAHLATPTPRRSPLALMVFDTPRLQALLAAVGGKDVGQFNYVGDIGMSIDATDVGLGIEFWGTWKDPAPQIAK